MAQQKIIPQRKRLAAVFASFSILTVGTASLMQSMSLDYYSVINTLQKLIPSTLAIGSLGWVIGMILDRPRKRQKIDYNNLFLNDVIKNNMTNININEKENKPETETENNTSNEEEEKGAEN